MLSSTRHRSRRDAASGLAHLHTHGVAHMDLKPENLFLHASGALKLGDLGIAVALDSPAGWQEGDGRYLAPEILARSGPSAAADVFSLGISLLQCATGAHGVRRVQVQFRLRLASTAGAESVVQRRGAARACALFGLFS